MKLFEITKFKKLIDPCTFKPLLKIEMVLPLENVVYNTVHCLTKASTAKLFYENFKEQLKEKLEEDENMIRTVEIFSDEFPEDYTPFSTSGIKVDSLIIPFYWIDMYQMTRATVITPTGEAITAMTVKTSISIPKDDFYKMMYNDNEYIEIRKCIKQGFAELREEGYKYFYTGSFSLVINPKTEEYEYNLLLRVAK